MLNRKTTLTCAAAGAITLATSVAALVQSSAMLGTSNQSSARSGSNVAIDRLALHYGAVMGSTENAKILINALGAGRHVTLGDTTAAGSGKAMGYVNVNIALALALAQAQANAKVGEDLSAQGFFSALGNVMERRAGGTGWGQIAKDLGFSLDQVLSASNTAQVATRTIQLTQIAAAYEVHGSGSVSRHWNGLGQGRAGVGVYAGIRGATAASAAMSEVA